ncbi:hypothetical protein CONPUDRAFT_169453 [Coniophora puteana RWD-64-598 SS2]|uniref:Uncharacterized protein n=1 Tax=Coniophora puteana (strain RWD-64-598) TaxID=741705 RepID=A0A5M3M9C1_CONPW|nr:uncharacterized protein CONPUDRAFT_169453 [Coniophora puteana RWD-64-598 SS2]EIW75703.1 hypothetical protein CONPUDRAFT_169453 [Coniophora puteana RWD-64-598 SS2]
MRSVIVLVVLCASLAAAVPLSQSGDKLTGRLVRDDSLVGGLRGDDAPVGGFLGGDVLGDALNEDHLESHTPTSPAEGRRGRHLSRPRRLSTLAHHFAYAPKEIEGKVGESTKGIRV